RRSRGLRGDPTLAECRRKGRRPQPARHASGLDEVERDDKEPSMIPWSLLDTAPVPGGDGELRLMRRGAEFSIKLGQNELMNSRLSGSEQALATLACDRIRARKRPRILIGGLGMGFTLRAALAVLGADAKVVVAELVPAVVAWARGPLAEVFGD